MATTTLTVKVADDFPQDALKGLQSIEIPVDADDLLPVLVDGICVPGDFLHGWGESSGHDSSSVAEAVEAAHLIEGLLGVIADLVAYNERRDAERCESRRLRAVGA
jgi:hypothetical protein